ncbi:MAG: hypothetical protein KDB16_18380 [Acidimicrobiales bacterium]|nr:hypothetical protein [Acidimicrobiales bacterium]
MKPAKLMLAAAVTLLLAVALSVPAGAAPSVTTPHSDVDWGPVWGPGNVVEVSFTNSGDGVQLGPTTVPAGFVAVADLCSGAFLGSAQTCIVRVQIDFSAELTGEVTGQLSVTAASDGAALASSTLRATRVSAYIAFAEAPNPDASPTTTATTGDDATFSEIGTYVHLRWGTGSLSLLPPDGGQFSVGVHELVQHSTDNPRVYLGGGPLPGELHVLEVAHDPNGSLSRLRAAFMVKQGDYTAGGVIDLSSDGAVRSPWAGSPVRDLGSVYSNEHREYLIAVNPTESPVSVSHDLDHPAIRTIHDDCADGTIDSRGVCVIVLSPDPAGSPGPNTVPFTLLLDGTPVAGEISVHLSRARVARWSAHPSGYGASAIHRDSNVDGDVTVFSWNRSTLTVAIDGLQFDLINETGDIGVSPNAVTIEDTDCAHPGELAIHDIAWSDDDQVVGLWATFWIGGCWISDISEEEKIYGYIAINRDVDLGVALADLTWVGLVYDPTDNRRQVVFSNPGDRSTGPLSFDALQDRRAFAVDDSDCVNGIAAGSECTVEVTYQPFGKANGSDGLQLSVSSVDGNFKNGMVEFFGTTPLDWRYSTDPGDPPYHGYWMLLGSGRVEPLGDAPHLGDHAPGDDSASAVRLEPTPMGRGYWVLDDSGKVSAHGDAIHHGEISTALAAGESAVSMSSSPSGSGYWIVTTQGRVEAFGDAAPVADLRNLDLAEPIISSVAAPSGRGLYMIGLDGGVFALGDALFAGSVPQVLPGVQLDAPVVGIVADPDGTGYWLVASDGGVFAFDAPFVGSLPGVLPPGAQLVAPINGMVPYGAGYVLVAGDGGVFNFSGLPFSGSLAGRNLEAPVSGIGVVAPDGGTYR